MMNDLKRAYIINEVMYDNTLELLTEAGKINIDYIDADLALLLEVLENEFDMSVEIQDLIGGRYLVNLDYERMV